MQENSLPHLLIVDDDLQTLEILQAQLDVSGLRVSVADSGQAALDFLIHPDRERDPVDAMLLDVMMPVMDGFQVLRTVKQDVALAGLPTIILTCSISGADEERARREGADDYIRKPWELPDLISRIQLVLDRTGSHQSLSYLNTKISALRISNRALLSTEPLEELLQIILGELKKVINYTSASIFLIERSLLQVEASSGFRSPSQIFAYQELSKLEHVQDVIRTKKAIIINNTFADPRWVHLQDSDYIRSWMGIPLIVKNDLIGILNVDMDQTDQFSVDDLEIATDFAQQASLAIENARLVKRLQRQTEMTRALVTASNKLAASVRLDVQLQAVWEFVSGHMHAPIFYVGICDPARRVLDIKSLYEMGIPQQQISLPLAASEVPTISTHVVLNGKPIQWRNFEERTRIYTELGISPLIIGSKCASSLIHPLISDGGVIGVIAIQSSQEHVWDDVDIDIFSALADMVAATASTSRVFHDIQIEQEHLVSAFDASIELPSSMDAEQALKRIVDRIKQVMNCNQVNVVMVDERLRLIHHAITGYEVQADPPMVMRPNGISRQVLKTGIPRFMDDLLAHAGQVHPELIHRGAKASACIPLPIDDQIIGVLWVHYDVPHHFTEYERKALGLQAKTAAKTYESIRRINELERLRRTAERLAAARSSDGIYETITAIAREEFHASSTAVWAYDDERKEFILEHSAASGIAPDVWERFKRAEPQKEKGGTAFTVMKQGCLPIQDLHSREERLVIGQSTFELLSSIGVKSFIGVALKADQEILGVLYINYGEERTFSASEREAAQAYALQAGLAAQKAKLFDQLEKAQQTAHIVAEQTAIGDLDQTLQSIVVGAKEVTSCDTVTLYTYDEKEQRFGFPPAMAGVIHRDKVVALDRVEKNSVPYRIVARDELHLSENVDRDPLIHGKFTEREGIKSFVGIPLVSNQVKVGVLCLSFRHRHRFTGSEISTIKLLAMQAAVAIQNGESYKKVREKSEIFESLHEASHVVTGLLNESEILKAVAREACKLTGIHGETASCCIGMLNKRNLLEFKTAYPEPYFERLHLDQLSIDMNKSEGTGICGRAIREARTQLLSDVESDPDYLALDRRTGSELVVPIFVGGSVCGVINVEHAQKFALTEEDGQALEMLAAHASIAIQNARTYEELKDAKLNIASLTNLFWASAFTQAWQHSIGNLSVIISDNVKLVRDDLARGYPLSDILDKLHQIEAVVEEIQSMPMPPLSAEDGIESILVHQLIQDRVKQYRNKHGRFGGVNYLVEIQTDLSISIRASREWIRRLFDILIHNAVNSMADRPHKDLTVRLEIADQGLRISIIDSGSGISPDLLPHLFESPVIKKKGEKGSGIGLYLGREIAKTYGGYLSVGTSDAQGTTMVLWFPVEA
jgi:GAF domain-containing protein